MDTGAKLLEVAVHLSGCPLTALIDCGATHNFLSGSLVSQLNLSPVTSDHMQVRLADTSTVLSSQTVRCAVKMDKELVELDFQVIPVLTTPLVLGMSFLEKVNPQIDWLNKTVRWNGNGGQVCLSAQPWNRSCHLQMVSVESLLQAYSSGNCTGFWRLDVACPSNEAAQLNQVVQCSQGVAGNHSLRGPEQNSPVAAREGSYVSSTNDEVVSAVLDEFADVFDTPKGMPPVREYEHHIKLYDEGTPPPKLRQYRLTQEELQAVRDNVDDYLSKGWIRPSTSSFGHPILIIRKKDGKLRMAVDYRTLNSRTVPDRHPLPRIDDILDSMHGCAYFSKLDLYSGYHQIRMSEADKPKTAFLSKWGLYEYNVLPLGLTNAPATFQRLVNSILRPYLDRFVAVYLDDIIVYSTSFSEHLEHLRLVLAALRQHSLFAKRSKCEFLKTRMEYLGHIISKAGMQPDPAKVEAIATWPVPKSPHDIQVFLGMTGYYARFIAKYAEIASPLTELLKKANKWQWGSVEQAAFTKLQSILTSAPLLLYPDFSLPFQYSTDASAVAVGGVLTQDQGAGQQPLQYYSKKLTSTEMNYSTEDRELLAIVLTTVRWRPYLAGGKSRAVCLTDHQPLTSLYTKPTEHLNKRQRRWIEKLADVNPRIVWRPGVAQVVPDALSRRPDYAVLTSLTVEPSFIGQVSRCSVTNPDEEMQRILQLANQRTSDFRLVKRFDLPVLVRIQGGKEQLVIPNAAGLRQFLLTELHCTPLVAHPGVRKTVDLLFQRVWWPKLRATVQTFVNGCDTCSRVKDSTQSAPGLLSPLPVPKGKFQDLSIDFVTDLPTSDEKNAILVVVDRLTKYVLLIPCAFGTGPPMSAMEVARLLFVNVICRFGVPSSIVHDRDSRFTADLWRGIWSQLGTRTLFSTAHHPQTDGQTERVNRTLGQMLRTLLLKEDHNKWVSKLPYIEFGMNTTLSVSTGKSPFELVFGVEPMLPIDAALGRKIGGVSAADFVGNCRTLIKDAQKSMARAQEAQKAQYDKKHRDISFAAGDAVMLSTRNLKLRGMRKLSVRWIGPFKVLAKVGNLAYHLDLPEQYNQLHPVFHVSLLKQYTGVGGDGSSTQVQPILDNDSTEYEVDRIIAERRRGNRKQYLVRWLGYTEADDTWQYEEDLANAPLVLQAWRQQQS